MKIRHRRTTPSRFLSPALVILILVSQLGFSQSATITSQSPIVKSEPATPEALQGLIKKNTAVAEILIADGKVGNIQLVWLREELLNALIDYYGMTEGKSKSQVLQLHRNVQTKLQTSDSLPFLAILKPIPDGLISNPRGKGSSATEIILHGDRAILRPFKLSQILDSSSPRYFTKPTWGYILFKKHATDGQSVIQPADLSFSVRMGFDVSRGSSVYYAKTEFHFDLVSVPISQIIDNTLPAWNNAVTTAEPYPQSGSVAQGNGRSYVSQASAVDLSRSDIFGILGLGLGIIQILLAL